MRRSGPASSSRRRGWKDRGEPGYGGLNCSKESAPPGRRPAYRLSPANAKVMAENVCDGWSRPIRPQGGLEPNLAPTSTPRRPRRRVRVEVNESGCRAFLVSQPRGLLCPRLGLVQSRSKGGRTRRAPDREIVARARRKLSRSSLPRPKASTGAPVVPTNIGAAGRPAEPLAGTTRKT